MQTKTIRPNEPNAIEDNRVVERQVETVHTRQSIDGTPVVEDATVTSRAVAVERSGGYFETLPERLSAVMAVVLTGLEGLLGMRFLLLAFGANPTSGFVGFIDDVSWPFVRPFTNIFNNRTWDQGVLEISTLVAMGVYFLAFALIGMLVTALAPRLTGGPDNAL